MTYDNRTATAVLAQQASSPVRMPEVTSEVEQLGYQLETMDKLLYELENRLEPILAKREVNTGSEASTPEPVRVPLADRLHQHLLHARVLTARVGSMTERIEL